MDLPSFVPALGNESFMLARKTSGGFKQGGVTRHEPVEQTSNSLPPTDGLVNDGGKHSIASFTFTAMEKYIGSWRKGGNHGYPTWPIYFRMQTMEARLQRSF